MANTNYNLSINIEAAEDSARKMQGVNNSLKEKLNEISGVINSMNDKWDADTSRQTVEKFNALKGQFDEYYNKVDKFQQFILTNVADAYRKNESTISVNTQNIQNEKAKI